MALVALTALILIINLLIATHRMLYCIAVNFLMSIFDNDLDFAFGFGAQRLVHITVII